MRNIALFSSNDAVWHTRWITEATEITILRHEFVERIVEVAKEYYVAYRVFCHLR